MMTQDPKARASGGQGVHEPFLSRVGIRNYKSIGKCDVSLARVTALVGRNGAGKSNFLDALRFVVDGLQTSLDHALKSRGGIRSVRRRSLGHPIGLAIRLEFNLPESRRGAYGFEITRGTDRGFSVKREQLEITGEGLQGPAYYELINGRIRGASRESMPEPVGDRLYLVTASGLLDFRPAYDALTSMAFYNLNPEAMKEVQGPDAGELLHRDGANIASVIARLRADAPEEKQRIEQYLGKIVSGVAGVDPVTLGPMETIEFRQVIAGAESPWHFYPTNMSDGTLRALGILVAASQLGHGRNRVCLIGIEEPEMALHPGGGRVLMDALMEAGEHTQVLLTTHSADLLEAMESGPNSLLAVEARQGETFIAPIDDASKKTIRDHLFSAGDLLRMDQLELDKKDLERQRQASLFVEPSEGES
jgi:predicted ATPase